MKEYARSKGGAHNIIVTPRKVQLLGEAKKKYEERLENERKKEFSGQQVRDKLDKLDDDLKLARRVLENASASLKAALDKMDLQGIQVAYELLESSRKKVDFLTKNREELSKKRDKLGEKRRNTIDNLFANIKKTKK